MIYNGSFRLYILIKGNGCYLTIKPAEYDNLCDWCDLYILITTTWLNVVDHHISQLKSLRRLSKDSIRPIHNPPFTYSHKRFFMLKSFYLTLIDASDQLGVSIVPMFGIQTSNVRMTRWPLSLLIYSHSEVSINH